MKLSYEACDKMGRRTKGVIEAQDAQQAIENLRHCGLFVSHVEKASPGATEAGPRRGRGGLSGSRLKNLAMFTRQLHVLVTTGAPLLQSLQALEKQASDAGWREVIGRVRQAVSQGSSLSQAMEQEPGCFDPIYRNLIASGESGGNFPAMLGRLADLVRRRHHIQNSVRGAMTYPVLLLGISSVVLGVMVFFVLPRFVELFDSLDVALPPTTQFLVVFSQLLQHYWWLAMLAAFGLVVGGVAWGSTASGRRVVDRVILRLPILGKIVKSFATARLVRLMGVLLTNRVPLLETLELCEQSTTNTLYRELMIKARQAVTVGQPISLAFNDPQLISPAVYEALCNGEQSGQVGAVLGSMADFLDDENEVVLRSLTSLIEPVILIGLGVFVGFVVISMFMPLFDLTAIASGGS